MPIWFGRMLEQYKRFRSRTLRDATLIYREFGEIRSKLCHFIANNFAWALRGYVYYSFVMKNVELM